MISMAKLKFDESNVEDLLTFHTQGSIPDGYPWEALLNHLNRYKDQMAKFAAQMPYFQQITCEELITKATELFIQYLLARYILATDGQNQLWWLFDGHLEEIFSGEKDHLQVSNIHLKGLYITYVLKYYHLLGNEVNIMKLLIKL